MSEPFPARLGGAAIDQTVPGESLRIIAPHATDDLPDGPCRALFVGEGGDLTLVAIRDDEPATLANIATGSLIPIKVRAVRSSGTTAGGLIAIY